jgi:glutathione S-transferase
MKVETYLRMVGIPFELINGALPLKAPKKKLPYIKDGTHIIGDSGFIVEYLKKTYRANLDANLSSSEEAMAHALRRMIEESLYWSVLYCRWIEDSIWPETRKIFFGTMPPFVSIVVSGWVKYKIRNALFRQGIGRHSREEIYEIGRADLSALSILLGEKPYFMGNIPTSVDATAYSFLANILVPPLNSPLKDHGMSLGNLSPYCERMKRQYYDS